ncbi:hypothetical protein C8R44DRAFT_888500 [Mycena epipterygia]|nr:hypothetical protein C8R44DRAFT_888500 [Mycena epipterygia]
MSIAPTYFDRHRGFAMGCILSGAEAGGLVMAPVRQVVLDRHGIRRALRIFTAWNFAVGVPTANGARMRINMGLPKRGTFLYQAIGTFLQAAGNVIPLYYMTCYSISVLSCSRSGGSALLAINSGFDSFSRIAMGPPADRVDRQNTLIYGASLSSLSVFALWYNAARERFIAFVVMYGIFAGMYLSPRRSRRRMWRLLSHQRLHLLRLGARILARCAHRRSDPGEPHARGRAN